MGVLAGLATAAGALVALVGGSGAGTPPASDDVFETLSARHAAADRVGGIYSSLPEAMPQVRHVIEGRELSVADAYVVGEVVGVEPGRAHRWTRDGDAEFRHGTAFNAPDTQAGAVHVSLRIERSVVDPDQPGDVKRGFAVGGTVRLGLALGASVDVEAVRERLTGLTLAALLYDSSAVFDYDPSLWAVLEDGGFLGIVGDERTVTFPLLEGSTFTLDELERPPARTVRGARGASLRATPSAEPTSGSAPASAGTGDLSDFEGARSGPEPRQGAVAPPSAGSPPTRHDRSVDPDAPFIPPPASG